MCGKNKKELLKFTTDGHSESVNYTRIDFGLGRSQDKLMLRISVTRKKRLLNLVHEEMRGVSSRSFRKMEKREEMTLPIFICTRLNNLSSAALILLIKHRQKYKTTHLNFRCSSVQFPYPSSIRLCLLISLQ